MICIYHKVDLGTLGKLMVNLLIYNINTLVTRDMLFLKI